MAWNRQRRSGYVFDSNTGFELPNGAMRAPDVAWVSKPRMDTVPEVQREKFLPLIYRPGAAMVELDNPTTLDCSSELPGFLLELEPIFNPQI